MSDTTLLILGLGNVLLGDDGVGPAVISRLRDSYVAAAGSSFLDGGTLGLSLLPHFEDAEAVILVDAVAADAAAGTLVRLEGDRRRSGRRHAPVAAPGRCRRSARRRALARSLARA